MANNVGRPRKEIKKDLFEKLCQIQCTKNEMASVFDVSTDTIERWVKREYGENFENTYKKHSAVGKMSLRRLQFRLAENSVPMAIFLGKQYLGQKDNPEGATTDMSKVDELLEGIRDSAIK